MFRFEFISKNFYVKIEINKIKEKMINLFEINMLCNVLILFLYKNICKLKEID